MTHFNLAMLAAAVSFACLSPAFAQDRDPTSSRDVTAQPISPAPLQGDIMLKFGQTAQIYFKHPIKNIRLDDEYTVRAVPKSDHIIAFTGLSPGRTTLVMESADGRTDSWGMVTVMSDPHEVRIYTPKAVNRVSGEFRQEQGISEHGYTVQQCNEIRCD